MNTTNNTGNPEVGANASNNSTNPEVKAPEKNMLMAILAYIGPLVIISYAVAKDDPFVKFHIKQGFVLLTIEVALMVLGMVLMILAPLIGILQLGTLVFSIIGIINVVGGKEKELPWIGKYSSHFKI